MTEAQSALYAEALRTLRSAAHSSGLQSGAARLSMVRGMPLESLSARLLFVSHVCLPMFTAHLLPTLRPPPPFILVCSLKCTFAPTVMQYCCSVASQCSACKTAAGYRAACGNLS